MDLRIGLNFRSNCARIEAGLHVLLCVQEPWFGQWGVLSVTAIRAQDAYLCVKFRRRMNNEV
jgi:hypothetical protein